MDIWQKASMTDADKEFASLLEGAKYAKTINEAAAALELANYRKAMGNAAGVKAAAASGTSKELEQKVKLYENLGDNLTKMLTSKGAKALQGKKEYKEMTAQFSALAKELGLPGAITFIEAGWGPFKKTTAIFTGQGMGAMQTQQPVQEEPESAEEKALLMEMGIEE